MIKLVVIIINIYKLNRIFLFSNQIRRQNKYFVHDCFLSFQFNIYYSNANQLL